MSEQSFVECIVAKIILLVTANPGELYDIDVCAVGVITRPQEGTGESQANIVAMTWRLRVNAADHRKKGSQPGVSNELVAVDFRDFIKFEFPFEAFIRRVH